eukprot:362940-Chlamydomonas_euryale.AAC.6
MSGSMVGMAKQLHAQSAYAMAISPTATHASELGLPASLTKGLVCDAMSAAAAACAASLSMLERESSKLELEADAAPAPGVARGCHAAPGDSAAAAAAAAIAAASALLPALPLAGAGHAHAGYGFTSDSAPVVDDAGPAGVRGDLVEEDERVAACVADAEAEAETAMASEL